MNKHKFTARPFGDYCVRMRDAFSICGLSASADIHMPAASKTIDERVEQLIPRVFRNANVSGGVGMFELLQQALSEVARDQRHACAEALLECESTHHNAEEWEVIHRAVMNAELPK